MSASDGRFVWYDIVTADRDATEGFYTDLLGWTIAKRDQGARGSYHMMRNGEIGFGGVEAPRAAGTPSHWMGYVGVSDCDATLARIERMGGSILAPAMDIPDVGRVAVFKDPYGAVAALYQGPQDSTWEPRSTEIGDFGWSEVATTDVAGAERFYGEVFGWTVGEPMKMPEGEYRMFHNAGQPIGGLFEKPPEMPVSAWWFYVNVTDVDAIAARAGALGAQVVHANTVPGMVQFAVIVDPRGAVFGVARDLSGR